MKKYNFHKRISLIGMAALACIPVSAQFNQSISVEGKYVPEVFRLDRINTFPKAVKFNLETTPLSYDATGVPTAFAPKLLPLPATGWNDTRQWNRKRGYIELGAGSWLNSTLSAGYRFIDNEQTSLGLRLQHNSTSLWKPQVSELMKDVHQKRYDESIGLYGSHDFTGKGRLSAALDWHVGYFNYYGYNPLWDVKAQENISAEKSMEAPSQTLNDVALRIGWQSPVLPEQLTWAVEAGLRYFGYRAYYTPGVYIGASQDTPPSFWDASGAREYDMNLRGSFNLPLSAKSSIGVDVNVDAIFSGNRSQLDGGFSAPNVSDYGILTLTPYYRFSRERLNVRVGADIDLSFNAGPENNRYNFLHVAPDITVDYQAGPAALYLHLLGGSRLNTLAANYERDYYQMPGITSSRPVYTPLDGSLGASFGPFGGFSAGVDFAFRITRGEYLGGWYQSYLNNYNAIPEGLPTEIEGSPLKYNFRNIGTTNLHGFSLGAHLSYDLGNIMKVNASGSYQQQNGSRGYFNGYDRPRWLAEISAETNPWRSLKLKLAYQYRGVRNIYTDATYSSPLLANEQTLAAMRLPDICYLNFGASYSFTDSFSLWAQADNLLNRHDILLPSLPQQGIRLALGFSLLF